MLHRSARNILILKEKSKTTCASENGHVSAPSLFSQARLRTANGRFQFRKRSQLFIRTHNETLSVVTVSVGNPVS
jgi:hypothetical protein